MRGNRKTVLSPTTCSRSIPACAGEPHHGIGLEHCARVYPRVCGGTRSYWPLKLPSSGLSPRVRGNPCYWQAWDRHQRSIPACAGEPLSQLSASRSTEVYPRVCGGTLSLAITFVYMRGLSPRVRGNPKRGKAAPASSGSIPACAGEPHPAGRSSTPTRVYPRVCGGTSPITLIGEVMLGLSPRVRGNR